MHKHRGVCRIRVVAIDPSCICGDFPCNTGCGDFAKASEECTLDLKLSTGAEPGSGSMVLAEESGAGCFISLDYEAFSYLEGSGLLGCMLHMVGRVAVHVLAS